MKKRSLLGWSIAACAVFAIPLPLFAQSTIVWNGAGDGTTFEDAANWVGGVVPGNGDTADIGANTVDINSGTVGFSIIGTGGITFDNGGDVEYNVNDNTYSGGTLVDGTTIRLNDGGGEDHLGTGTITLDNGGALMNRNTSLGVNNDIILGAGGGAVNVGWNGRVITLNGDVSGTGLLTVGNDSSTLRLEGANNTYSGGTVIEGFVQAENGTLGTGAITLDNTSGDANRGVLQNRNPGADVFANDLIVTANGGQLQAGWNTVLEIQGVASGAGQLNIREDSGTVVLNNSGNTFSGDIVLDGVNSRLSVATLESGSYDGVISGDGTFTITDSLNLEGDNTITGVTTVTSSGILGGDGSIDGDLVIDAGGQLVFDGTTNTPLSVAGSVTLDSTFGVDDLVGLTSSTAVGTYALIDETATVFASGGIENFGQANAFDLGNGNLAFFEEGLNLVVFNPAVVPEPSSLAIVGLLGMGLVSRRRRS